MIITSAPWFIVPSAVASVALLSLGGVSGILGLFTRRQSHQPSAHLVIGNKKHPLREPVRLGRSYWQRITGKSVDDVVDDHAELFQAADGAWEVRLSRGEHMFIDGLRSRHNRLQSGAVVALGESRQVVFQFVSRG